MSYFELVNSSLLYILVAIVILFVFLLAFFFAKKSWDYAIKLGYKKQDLRKVVKSTVLATIVPSFAIVIGLFALAPILGNAWPWLRLSVIGSVAYELVAAETATVSLLGDGVVLENASVESLVTVMLVMTVGISSGLITLLFFGKQIQKTVKRLGENKKSFSFVALECFMVGYWESDSLRFVSNSGITRGYANTLEGYKRRYPDIQTMGKLQFTIISVEQLSPEACFVVGKYHLTREMGNAEGHFSL